MATTIQFDIPDDVYRRLRSHPDFPLQQWGKKNVPAFYRKVFLEYVESPGFRLSEAQAEIRRLDDRIKALEWRESLAKRSA